MSRYATVFEHAAFSSQTLHCADNDCYNWKTLRDFKPL